MASVWPAEISIVYPRHNQGGGKEVMQNRRQKVVNRRALHFCGGLWVCAGGLLVFAGGLDTLKIDKNSTDL